MPLETSWLTPGFVSRLETLRLSVRWVRAGHWLGGRFPVNRRGSSVEFADYTPYSAGDDVRAIDWNLYARLDRLYVKTYKEEIQLSVEILLDATASMGLPSAAKFERATQVALSLGYVALTDRHHVRFSWIRPCPPTNVVGGGTGPIETSPWYHQRGDLPRMVKRAQGAETAHGHVPLSEWMTRVAASRRMRGGQAILITDGMYPPADFFRAMHALLVRNLEIKVVQVISPQELHPARLLRGGLLVDSETGHTHQLAYRPAELEQAVVEHNERLVRFCKRHGIPFAQHRLDESLESFMVRTLPTRGFLE